LFIRFQRLTHSVANVKALTCTAQIAILVPIPVAIHLVYRIKAVLGDQACRQTQCHGGVVRPLTRFQAEGATTNQIHDWWKRAARLELDRCTDSVADGKPKKATAKSSSIRFHALAP
jgi:hypothetical protein